MKIPKHSRTAYMIRTLAGLAADNLKSQRSCTGHPYAQFFEGKAQAFRMAAKYVAFSTTWKKSSQFTNRNLNRKSL